MDDRKLIEEVEKLLQYIPARPDYDIWIKVISAVGNTFNKDTALLLLNNRFSEEKEGEIEHKLNNRLKKINFATLVYLAKQNGYITKFSNNGKKIFTKPKKKRNCEHTDLSKETNIIYRFIESVDKKESSKIDFCEPCDRDIADKYLTNNNMNTEYERIFRVAINKSIIDKNINPITNKSYRDYTAFISGFKNVFLSFKELIDAIKNGYSFSCCQFITNEQGNIKKNSSSFLHAELIAIDIDDSLSINEALEMEETRDCLFIYTTKNHTEKRNRFRIVFALPTLFTIKEDLSMIIKDYINKYKGDKNCSDLTRGFFGNSNAKFYNNNGDLINV